MFDNIGVGNDPEAAGRSAGSMVLTAGLFGGLAGLVVGISAFTAVTVVQSEATEQLVQLIEQSAEDFAPPPPPPPPPPAAADAPTQDAPESGEPAEVQELKDEVSSEIRSDAKPAGVAGGVPGGTGTAPAPAPAPAPTIKAFRASDLELKKRVPPEYPPEAVAANLGEQKCLIKVIIDEEGVPTSATVTLCPSEFHASAKDAILRWRWYPAKEGTQRIKAQTSISITYRPTSGG